MNDTMPHLSREQLCAIIENDTRRIEALRSALGRATAANVQQEYDLTRLTRAALRADANHKAVRDALQSFTDLARQRFRELGELSPEMGRCLLAAEKLGL